MGAITAGGVFLDGIGRGGVDRTEDAGAGEESVAGDEPKGGSFIGSITEGSTVVLDEEGKEVDGTTVEPQSPPGQGRAGAT